MINNYKFPDIELLNTSEKNIENKKEELNKKAEIIKQTLESFKINVTIENISVNQRITRYEIKPDKGIRMKRISLLTDDIALNLGSKSIRVEAIPERQTIGIEVPNLENHTINLRNIIQSQLFQENDSETIFAIGEDINGNKIIGNISNMPHILIAGATGSGKSVFINSLIISLLYKSNPDNLKLILIDPKKVELSSYNNSTF